MIEPVGDGKAGTSTGLADGCVFAEASASIPCGGASAAGLADGCVFCNGTPLPNLAPFSTRAWPVYCRAGRAARRVG
eukprot:2285106-Alexandrium_andersonii.AAC.1